jgi:hypothetical protein
MDSEQGVRVMAPFRRRRAATTSDIETQQAESGFIVLDSGKQKTLSIGSGLQD